MSTLTFNTTPEVYLLIVEDDHDDCVLIQDCFQQLNWQQHVKTLSDADKLFNYLDALSKPQPFPSLILLDCNLPRLSGEAILVLLKKDPRYKTIPVAFYSTSMTDQIAQRLWTQGANFCRKKPATIDGMYQLMVELMEFTKTYLKDNMSLERTPK